ncbi:hypothetical protein B0H10DRAFT_1967360 [Mycena sp. CBHHK59/15]|nr:hypothetical protein B0H10DRAFT_1967360 [Mycena sp. CBHHK59/15]
MIALLISSLVVLVSLAVPAASLANTSTYRIPVSPSVLLPQPSFWRELATSHFYIPLILLASALGRYQLISGGALFSLFKSNCENCQRLVATICLSTLLKIDLCEGFESNHEQME